MYGSTLRNAHEIYSYHSGAFGHSLSRALPSNTSKKQIVNVNPSQTFISDASTQPRSQHVKMGNIEHVKMDNIAITKETHSDADADVFNTNNKAFDSA